MAASLISMLDDLEARLDRTQAELQALREENQWLKQQLASEAPAAETQEEAEAEALAEVAEFVEAEAVAELENEMEQEDVAETEHAAAADIQDAAATPTFDHSVVPNPVAKEQTSTAQPQSPSPHALLNQWYERYPKAFFKGHTKPLKIGIHQDLAEREEWPNKLIRRALANYVNLPRYIKAVRIGAERVDLDGQPAGKVDKEAALHAAEKRGEKQESKLPKKPQAKVSPVAKKPRQEAPKPPEGESSEPHKSLSMEDKLLGLQQKFKGR